MPAVSQSQQRYMATALHEPEKLKGKRPKMTSQQLHDFATTPVSDLPERAPEPPKRNSYRRRTK